MPLHPCSICRRYIGVATQAACLDWTKSLATQTNAGTGALSWFFDCRDGQLHSARGGWQNPEPRPSQQGAKAGDVVSVTVDQVLGKVLFHLNGEPCGQFGSGLESPRARRGHSWTALMSSGADSLSQSTSLHAEDTKALSEALHAEDIKALGEAIFPAITVETEGDCVELSAL